MSIFIKGRDDLSVTMLIPTACHFDCKFCTCKEEYRRRKPDKDLFLQSIDKINNLDIPIIVISGGEPFSDLNLLKEIVDRIDDDKTVYINTTGVYADKTKVIDFINSSKIASVSISRHRSSFEQDQATFCPNILNDDDIKYRIHKRVKVNCVITEDTDFEKIVERWRNNNITLQFRKNFKDMTLQALKSLNDPEVNSLLGIKGLMYSSHNGCDVCFNVNFKDIGHNMSGYLISYHKGLEYTAVHMGDFVFVNDIVVLQDGTITYDWDGKTDDIDDMLNSFSRRY